MPAPRMPSVAHRDAGRSAAPRGDHAALHYGLLALALALLAAVPAARFGQDLEEAFADIAPRSPATRLAGPAPEPARALVALLPQEAPGPFAEHHR